MPTSYFPGLKSETWGTRALAVNSLPSPQSEETPEDDFRAWIGKNSTVSSAQPTPPAKKQSLFSMRRRWQSIALVLGAALVCVPAPGWSQPSYPGQDSGAKQDMKDAGHNSKNAAKDAGHGVKQGTKKAYHKTKNGTKKAWHKTRNTAKGATSGAKQGAKQPD